VNSTVAKHIDQELRRSWYTPSSAALDTASDLLGSLISEGVPLPSLSASLFGGAQCEWAGKTGAAFVCIDEKGRVQLIESTYEREDCDVVADPAVEQIVGAVKAVTPPGSDPR
jgi:hypothetical protein